MGPDDFPSRPRFHWDIRSPPWTDGKGPQDQYYSSVVQWKRFHDLLREGNSNRIPSNLQGIVLQSQLFGRAADLVKKLSRSEVEADDGALTLASAVHRRDLLSVVTDTFHRYLELLQMKQGGSESFKNFETRFDAQVCKLNATCNGSEMPSGLVSFLLLANSRITATQRISILSATVPTGIGENVSPDDVHLNLLSMIKYADVASIARACDEPRKPYESNTRPSPISSYRASYDRQTHFSRQKQTLNPDQLADLKSKSICRVCHELGHWAEDVDKCKGSKSKATQASSSNLGPTVTPQGTMQFNMTVLPPATQGEAPGPIVDDGAPYSGLGMVEIKTLAKTVLPEWNGELDELPASVRDRPFWQYGSGEHSSDVRRILGSVTLGIDTDQGNLVLIRHLIVEGSSQWVIGRNVTRQCNILHVTENCLEFKSPNTGTRQTISMVDVGDHSFIPATKFCVNDEFLPMIPVFSLVCSSNAAKLSWNETKHVIEKVHKHVCGHANYDDIKLLLQRNKLWTGECAKYSGHLLECCVHCDVVQAPSTSRKVSLRSFTQGFNNVVCVDHFFQDNMDVFHMMDKVTRYSIGAVVPSTSLRNATLTFDSHWLSQFWPPQSVQGDQAFYKDEFTNYLKLHDISFSTDTTKAPFEERY